MDIPERAKEILLKKLSEDEETLIETLKILPEELLEELWRTGLKNKYLRKKIFQNTKNQELIREVYNTKTESESEFLNSLYYYEDLNPNCPKDILEDLYKATKELFLINHPNFPIKIIINDESKLKNIDIAEELSKNPNCPPEILRKLSEIDNYSIHYNLALNKNTPVDILQKLIKLNRALSEIANHPSIDGESLKYLYRKAINTKDLYLRKNVLKNPNCPEDVIKMALSSNSITDKKAIAENPKTPKEFLIKLSKSKNYIILKSIVNNPSCPEIVLLKLTSSGPEEIKEMVKERLKSNNTKGG